MFHILFWIIVCLGATHIITGTKIFEWLRNLMDKVSPNFFGVLFNCPTCMGFWTAILIAQFIFPLVGLEQFKYKEQFLLLFVHGCFGSYLNYCAHLIMQYVDENTTNIQLKNELIVNNPFEMAQEIINEQTSK